MSDTASDASMSAEEKDNIQIDELQDNVQDTVKQWKTARGTNCSTTNFFRELVGKVGVECKQQGKKKYLNRALIRIWKGDVLKDIKKKGRFKQLVVRSMDAYLKGKFDIARSTQRITQSILHVSLAFEDCSTPSVPSPPLLASLHHHPPRTQP